MTARPRPAFGLSAGAVFFNPAAASTLTAIVDENELVAANSGLWSAGVVSQIALAPAGGALVAAWGVAPAFLLSAASFAISAAVLARLRLSHPPTAVAAGSWACRIRDGARLLIADRPLRLLAAVQLLAATRNLPVAMAALGLYGVGTSTGMVTYTSLLQAEVAAPIRGRVFAGFDMIWQTGRLISLGLGGLAADSLGIQAVYLLGGILLLLAGSLGLAGMRAVTPGSGTEGPA